MEFSDKRGRRIIYLSRCLLNQNSRTPGIAGQKGAVTGLVQVLLGNDLGIEQLPCPECLFWGGVSRKGIYKKQPMMFGAVGKPWFPIVELLFKLWIRQSDRNCAKEAARAVDRMEDFIREGYEIVGLIGVDDSPTCGVTKTLNLLRIVNNHKALGITLNDFETPRFERLAPAMPKMQETGSGAFVGAILAGLKKRGLNIKTTGFDPWLDAFDEVRRIAAFLNLEWNEGTIVPSRKPIPIS
ncbi:MAG TPA: hypothetical protein VMK12_26465 [Anaeromyxobacteraceae bacterium]|nr:hypothetical protein [Anaeromyxobacteraceae bacterium]